MRALAFAFLALAASVQAQQRDPNLEHPNAVVTAARDGYTIAGLVTHKEGVKAFRYGVLLFPGSPGIMEIREGEGELRGTPRYGMTGNFLIRSRRHWLDDETLLVSVDAPSDRWNFFPQLFRETPRYGADVAALVAEVSKRYGGIRDWTFIGTSEGSVSAFHAARMNPALATRLILTASVFTAGRNGPGISAVDYGTIKAPILWVHHENDPCRFTQYSDARRYSERTMSPLITVRGGGPESGDPCEARTHHGFVGAEVAAIRAMQTWIRTGVAAPEARP